MRDSLYGFHELVNADDPYKVTLALRLMTTFMVLLISYLISKDSVDKFFRRIFKK